MKLFKPIKVRMALDERDGFTEKKRAAAYNLLCELASHPTYKGLRMLAPKGQPHHCGPFLDPTALKALIEELVKLAIQAGMNFNLFFRADTKAKMMTKISFMEIFGQWAERYYHIPFNRKNLEEMKKQIGQLK